MPEICIMYGIRITMNYNDHTPSHFHAEYAGNTAMFDIINGCILKGSMPHRQLRIILAWIELHKDELMQDWELARAGKPLLRINAL